MWDRTVYFDHVREDPFPGRMSQTQVDGQNAILTRWEDQWPVMTDPRWLAYMLATTYHETAFTMWPIEEFGKGQGHEYGKIDPETGQAYYGRGFVQLTWQENYEKATDKLGLTGHDDLVWHADRALDLKIASDVMFQGMSQGWFTGKKLQAFFSTAIDDPTGARIIINRRRQERQEDRRSTTATSLRAVEASWGATGAGASRCVQPGHRQRPGAARRRGAGSRQRTGVQDMINAVISLIVWLVIVGMLYAIAAYAAGSICSPSRQAGSIKVVLIVLLGLAAVLLLLDLIGVGTGLDLPRVTAQ